MNDLLGSSPLFDESAEALILSDSTSTLGLTRSTLCDIYEYWERISYLPKVLFDELT